MIEAEIKKGVGKKSGKEYVVVEIQLTPDYKKLVFLDLAETALVKTTYEI